jgi:hypothetical protein
LFSIAQHEDLFPPEVKTDLPELIPLRRYLSGRAALLDIFETVSRAHFLQNNRGPVAQILLGLRCLSQVQPRQQPSDKRWVPRATTRR